MTPQQLRNSILQMAIEGKLVEQRPEEGTGEELYQLIQAEKDKLIKVDKIKKEKSVGRIEDNDTPFEIPDSWKWCYLGELFSHVAGKALNAKNTKGIKCKYLTTSNVYWDYFNLTNLKEMYYTEDEIEKYSVKYGDLLVLEGEDVGRSAIWNLEESYCIQNHIHRLRPYINISVTYFYYILMYFKYTGNILGKGIGIKSLSAKALHCIKVPLPPLNEQYRIVDKIGRLFPFVKRYEIAWQKLNELNKKFPEELKKSILQEAIQGKLCGQKTEDGAARDLIEKILIEKERLIETGQIKKQKDLPPIQEDEILFDIPENWEWVRLGNIGETNVGLTYKPIEVSNSGTIVLRSNNIQDGVLVYTDVVKVSKEIPMSKMCQIGDIIICARNGSKRLVGKAALIDIEGMSFGAFMAVYRSICNPYILKYINSVQFRKIMLPEVGTTTINQITQESLRKCVIPMPPLTEQDRIIKKVDQIMEIINWSKKIFLR